MKQLLMAGALAAAWLPGAASAAPPQHDMKKLHTLMRLERLTAPAANLTAPTFTRNASMSVTGTIKIVSPGIVGPLFCSIAFYYYDPNTQLSHSEFKTGPVDISGKTGTCNLKVPFRWQNVSDSSQNVSVYLGVGNATGLLLDATVAQPLRVSRFEGPSLPLALEGEDVHFTFDIRI